MITEFNFKTSVEAWKKINRALIDADAKLPLAEIKSNQVVLYDTLIRIQDPTVPDDWNFTTTVNYAKQKWTGLINNYVNKQHLQEVLARVHHRELKGVENYNETFQFSNQHSGGKGCLLAATFSRRYGDKLPSIHAVFRASELYKRGMFDFLLLYRLGQAAWGEDARFTLDVWCHQLWGGVDWLAMLSSVIPPRSLFKYAKPGNFAEKVKKKYDYFANLEDVENLSYHAHKRPCKVIQKKTRPDEILAGHCFL